MRRCGDERGFTLIEVVLALVMLSIILLGTAAASGKLIHTATVDRAVTQAGAAADARIALVRQWPDYATLDQFDETEVNTPEPGWTRTTVVTRVGGSGQANDFRRVTVTVTGPGLPNPVARTITVAAP